MAMFLINTIYYLITLSSLLIGPWLLGENPLGAAVSVTCFVIVGWSGSGVVYWLEHELFMRSRRNE